MRQFCHLALTFVRVVERRLTNFLPTYRHLLDMHAVGVSLTTIARRLNVEGVATARGGAWYPSTVLAMVTSETAKTL